MITSRFQQGATLIIALVLLLVMSLLAATAMRSTVMQERMSANTYDRDLAFQSAEAGLRMGERLAENWAKGGGGALPSCQTPNVDGIYDNTNVDICKTPLWESTPGASGSYWHNSSGDTGTSYIQFQNDKLSLAPFYIVELIEKFAPCDITQPNATATCKRFRITAASQGEGRAQVILQSIYATE